MEKRNRGTATSFGFKKPVTTISAIPRPPTNPTAPLAVEELTNSVESLVITPTARSGTPRLARPKKDNGTNARTNRFGFRSPQSLSNKVADSQNVNSTKANLRLEGLVQQTQTAQPQPTLIPHTRSHLPRPQFPVRLAAPAHYHPRTASADKSAKTVANNHTARRSRSENGGSSASSVNDADSGLGSQKSGGELEIEQLEHSPFTRNRIRSTQKSRPMEMIFPGGPEKKFELRDLRDSVEVTEILPLELPPLTKRLPQDRGTVRNMVNNYTHQMGRENNSGSSEDDEGIEDESGEEKLHRDRLLSEKDEKGVVGAGEEVAEAEELWGHGEAMVTEDDMPLGQDVDSDPGCQPMTPPLRSVLLSIEDHSFAALAAMSTSTMLEDESYPELPDFNNSLSFTSTSPATSPNNSQARPRPPDNKNSEGSPGSPSTPTHTSNSLSLSSDNRGDRDFIDDEICDQPGLVYNNVTVSSAGNTLVPDESSPRPPLSAVAQLTADGGSGSARHSSVGTLSPCESIASDDLIMDFDLSAVDDDHRHLYRLDTSSIDLILTDGEGEDKQDITGLHHSPLQHSPLTRPELMNGVRATRQLRPRVGSSGSGPDSSRSLDTPRLRSGSALSSPLRSSRQGTSSPGEDLSEDSGIRVTRGDYQSMYQDVINMKALLLRLSRVMQESEAENSHETTQKNGFCSLASDAVMERAEERVADLQRQVVFLQTQMVSLQSQLEEKERTIRSLQTTHPRAPVDTCNAATQTDRVRPLSTGPILSTQPDAAGGSFVSNSSEPVQPQAALARPVSRLPQWRHPASPSSQAQDKRHSTAS